MQCPNTAAVIASSARHSPCLANSTVQHSTRRSVSAFAMTAASHCNQDSTHRGLKMPECFPAGAAQHSTTQHSAAQYQLLPRKSSCMHAQESTAQHSTAQHSTQSMLEARPSKRRTKNAAAAAIIARKHPRLRKQHSTAQQSAVQHSTALLLI